MVNNILENPKVVEEYSILIDKLYNGFCNGKLKWNKFDDNTKFYCDFYTLYKNKIYALLNVSMHFMMEGYVVSFALYVLNENGEELDSLNIGKGNILFEKFHNLYNKIRESLNF